MISRPNPVLSCFALFLLAAFQLPAQTNQGALAGTVVDPSGAVVPSAKIMATDKATGVAVNTVSSSSGVFRFSNLAPGTYSVRTEVKGFAPSVTNSVSIAVSVTTALKIEVNPTSVSTQVTVTEGAPTVETQSSQISSTVTPLQVEELPLSLGGTGALRSPEAFVYLTPGVTGQGTVQGGNTGVWSQRITGNQSMSQEVTLDGIPTDRTEWHQEFDETAPSVDAIQEFTVQTSTIPAEYGHTGGGVVNFVTKGGTNQFHGELYDIFRNEDLDANTWFNNGYKAQAGYTQKAEALYQRPFDKKNDYGGTIGGPVWIPKLYNGRNKTFFFFSGEQYRQSVSGTTVSTLPTAAMRNGDFSSLLGSATGRINPCDGSPILKGQIFDPSTTHNVGSTTCRTAFPGNISPRIDSVRWQRRCFHFFRRQRTTGTR